MTSAGLSMSDGPRDLRTSMTTTRHRTSTTGMNFVPTRRLEDDSVLAMRAVPEELDASVVAQIDGRLAGVEIDHGVRVAWAIESGSRAWGFPSPDSDYDCRFIYVRPREDYLALWPHRDVIETPLDKVLDVNGWDLAKTVRLLVKGNAVAIEWLRSPIVYTGGFSFRDGLLALADDVVERASIGRHYLHVARRQQEGSATLKRFFYVLRTASALRWLHDHPDEVVPPMDLPTLLAQSDVGDAIRRSTDDLIAAKARTREMGSGSPPPELVDFVDAELERAAHFETDRALKSADDVQAAAEAYFRRTIETTDAGTGVGSPVSSVVRTAHGLLDDRRFVPPQ
ncbi:nucleotidyltransferase domain-containing protein [Frigoribacterium sp. 2-23]|uniref:nucleotidyltransferase domain-containing protein n=1 Tax=Frigoribacterium sp. 2-23 TaxID=3415006 RepID=UPI003C6F0F73